MSKKLNTMENETSNKYVSEIVWLPTYAAIVILVLGSIENSAVATLTLIAALYGSRMVLELIYRIIFGDQRLLIKTGVIAFLCQVLVLTAFISWS